MQRVPAATDVEIGTLLRDPQGHMFIVTSKDATGYMTAELEDVTDGIESGEEWEERVPDSGWDEKDYPQTKAGVAEPDVIAAIYERAAYTAEVAEIMANVAPTDHRALYNAIAGVRHWGGKLTDAQQQVNDYAGYRADELRKVVRILGTQDKAAKLLGTNQSTISRALRER